MTNILPHTLTGFASDVQRLWRAGCSHAPEKARVWLGGASNAQQQAAAKRARLFSKMGTTAKAVGVVALAVILGGALAVGTGILVSNGFGGALLAAYGQGVTAQQLTTLGSAVVLGGLLTKVGAWITERAFAGMQARTVDAAREKNWGWLPSQLIGLDQ